MNSMLLDTKNFVAVLSIVVMVVVGVLVALSIFTTIWKWVLIAKYSKLNKKQVSTGYTGAETARNLLSALGIDDVEVVKCNFFSAFFLGNSYSPFKKRIRLRGNIYNNKSLTAVALATQKVALAKKDKDGDKKIKARAVFMTLGYFSPFAVVPLFLIGVLIDIFAFNNIGSCTIIFSAIAILWYLSSFVVLLLNIPIEKKACNKAVEYLQTTKLINEEEIEDAKELYKTYIVNYVLDFVEELLYLVWRILKLVLQILPNK